MYVCVYFKKRLNFLLKLRFLKKEKRRVKHTDHDMIAEHAHKMSKVKEAIYKAKH